jgi:hypothetical protein
MSSVGFAQSMPIWKFMRKVDDVHGTLTCARPVHGKMWEAAT